MKKFAALLRRDVRGIYRDGFLLAMAGYALLIAVATRIAVRLVPVADIELYVAPFVIITAASLIGLVFGFGMIEERETKTALLVRVLPVSPATLTAYWMVAVSGFCFAIVLASAALYGVVPVRPMAFLVLSGVTALGAPLVMLLLGALATNKIEGLAMGKIISGSSLALAVLFVLPARWQILIAWYPWYWLYLGLLDAYAGVDTARGLAVAWPAVPGWTFAVAPALLTVAGIGALARRAATRN